MGLKAICIEKNREITKQRWCGSIVKHGISQNWIGFDHGIK